MRVASATHGTMCCKRPHRRSAIVATLIAFGLLGCSSEPVDSIDKPLFPASGKISYRGKPIPNARVTFHPIESLNSAAAAAPSATSGTEGTPPALVRTPFAVVKEDGTFELSTLKPGDGAPEGEYAVTVSWTGDKPAVSDSDMPEKLPLKFQNPAFSGLRVRVKNGEPIPEIKLN
ncbi:MAG: hypothetical protein ACKO38_02100 [Planctomycetota bacterium]